MDHIYQLKYLCSVVLHLRDVYVLVFIYRQTHVNPHHPIGLQTSDKGTQTEKLLPFSIPEDTKLTSKFFFCMLTLGHICCSFAFVLVSISLIHGCRVKGTLSIKMLVWCPPELEFCVLRIAKKS